MSTLILRFIASPALAPHALDELSTAGAASGRLLGAVNDSDINASTISMDVDAEDGLKATAFALAERCRGHLSAGRAFRLDVLGERIDELSDESLRALAVQLHGVLSAPVYIARRDVPAAAWAFTRPMPWGRKGLSVGQTSPTLPFGGSQCLGVAIEVGLPTVLAKARLDDVPEHGLVQACGAVGGAESGFADVGAYAGVSSADGASVVILEFSNLARSPLHRALAVLDIEARRFGGRLGQVSIVSHVPLSALLDVLKAGMGLHATGAQVLETHLPADGSE